MSYNVIYKLDQDTHPGEYHHTESSLQQESPKQPIHNFSVYEEIDNDPKLSSTEKINKKIKYQNRVDFSPELKKHGLEQYANNINHYTAQTINLQKQQELEYGIIVNEETYNNHYYYHIGYIRNEDENRPSGYNTVKLGFVLRSSLQYHQPDRIWNIPSYRVRSDDNSKFIKDINQLFVMLKQEKPSQGFRVYV